MDKSEANIVLPRKWQLKAHGQRVVFTRGGQERPSHVLMKAFLWALYLPEYPHIYVETRIGDKYKPDVVAFDPTRGDREGDPLFWGESGQVSRDKIRSLLRRFPDTHFAIAKWSMRLDTLAAFVRDELEKSPRNAPFDLLRFDESHLQSIDSKGNVTLQLDDVEHIRL